MNIIRHPIMPAVPLPTSEQPSTVLAALTRLSFFNLRLTSGQILLAGFALVFFCALLRYSCRSGRSRPAPKLGRHQSGDKACLYSQEKPLRRPSRSQSYPPNAAFINPQSSPSHYLALSHSQLPLPTQPPFQLPICQALPPVPTPWTEASVCEKGPMRPLRRSYTAELMPTQAHPAGLTCHGSITQAGSSRRHVKVFAP